MLSFSLVAAIVCFTSLTEEDNAKASQMGIKTYSWTEFLHLVRFHSCYLYSEREGMKTNPIFHIDFA